MKMPVETMTSSPLSRFLHLDKLKAGLLSSDTVQLSDGGPNTPELVPLTKENCPTIRDPQKTHPAELDAAVIPPSTTVPTSHKAPIPGPYYSSQHNGPSPSRQPGSTQSTEEVSLSLNQTIQGHSSAPSKELPGNKPKKAFFFMPVSSHNWSVEDYAKRFDYVSKQLMGAVSKNSNLRCRSQHIIYKSVMIGVSEDTAVPCVLIQCRKKEYKDLLKLIGDLDTGLIGCYMCSNSIFSRTFRSQRLSNDPPFEIIIEAHARGPLRRRAGEIATISLTSETVCGASVRYQDRIATISLVLSIDGIYRLVTVDHLFNPDLDSEELTDDENSSVDSSTQGRAVDQKGGRDEKFDSEMTQAETVSMNPAIVSLDHTSAPHSPEASNVLALHGGIATHVVKPPFPLHSAAPYLDWTVLEFVWNSGLPLLNMIYLNDSKSPTILRYVAESPKFHGTPVYMISGTGKLKEGNLLTGVTYLGPRGRCDPCEVWTMLLESSKGLMPGESGSLVVDRETFAVYGHVVGTDILDNVYVVPLTQTIRQIESTFHAATVCLPDLAQSSKRAASPPMYSDGMKPQYGITEVKKRRGRAAPPGRCQSCNRINTTEWRRGPDGARTLCNACGLHYAKVERKRQLEARSIRPKPEAAPTDNEIPVKNRKIEHPEVSELIQRANENADVEKELDSTDSDMSVSDDNGANGMGIGSGNDQDERRKPVALYTESGLSLACPFAKRYPGEKQPRCDRGWPTVHRVKQHIYRAHRQPIHCERCFQTFESVEDLGFHLCTIVDRPLEIPGVDSETIERLKSRKGLNKLHEIEKWKRVYEILFPDAKDIPPPYYNLPTIETAVTAEVRAQCRREVAPRAIRAISDTLRNMPGFQFNPKLSEQQFFEMISASVWNAFDAVLPNSPPQTVSGNVVPGDMKAQETTDRVLGQLSPAPSSVPQPTGLSKLDQASSTSNNTNNQELIHILNGQTHDPFGSGDSGYYTAHGSNFAF